MKKIALFGGSFDPPHFGHLNLALYAKERLNLDEVWFCPARQNPLKADSPIANGFQRAEMVELAISEVSNFHLLLSEVEGPKLSYSIDTVRQFKADLEKQGHPFQLFYLLGDESLASFSKWKEPEAFIKETTLLVGKRAFEKTIFPSDTPQDIVDALKNSVIETPFFEISSTQIRARLKNQLYCGYLMPDKVIDYIFKHQLYLNI